jgi:hypothetical protein
MCAWSDETERHHRLARLVSRRKIASMPNKSQSKPYEAPCPDCGEPMLLLNMPTIAHCRKRARELTELAEREPENRTQHLNDAAGWLLLARRTEELKAMALQCFATA